MANRWLLPVYKIPREPTAGRVFVWRKLKQLGAFTLRGFAISLGLSHNFPNDHQMLTHGFVMYDAL
ncbi:MAG: hypothetical protein WD648_05865 [Planctomycetaceae bacterium]